MNRLQHYQKYQRWYEFLLLSGFLLVNNTLLATTVIMENSRNGADLPFELWEPFVWEYSSAVCTIMLIPALGWLLKEHPLSWTKLRRSLALYLCASFIFSGLHIAGMVTIRKVIYWWQNRFYEFGDLPFEIIYEYRKDAWSFVFIIVLIVCYRFILDRLQGEASLVGSGEEDLDQSTSDRILVKKLGREFIIKISDIEWLESSGNYVNLHVGGRIYPLRSTLNGLVQRIADKGFCRIHRSYGVNLDAIESINPLGSGDSEVMLKNGKVLNLSRRYKDQLKIQLQ